jgi:predicted nucleotidyltransferase
MYATSKSIESLVQNIVETVHPLKIILFGSYARGTENQESDIDVLVVMPEGAHCRRTAQLLYRQIKRIGIPFDILVTTPSTLEKHKDNIGLIYRAILKEGREIYVA